MTVTHPVDNVVGPQYMLQNWEFLATNDPPVDELELLPGEKTPERQWVVLDKHEMDTSSFFAAYQAALFPLDPRKVKAVSYRFFKVVQTGPNSRGNNHMLMVGGVELFGHLTGCPTVDDSDDPTRPKHEVEVACDGDKAKSGSGDDDDGVGDGEGSEVMGGGLGVDDESKGEDGE